MAGFSELLPWKHKDLNPKEIERLIDECMTRVEGRRYSDDSASIIDLLEAGSLLDELHRRGERRRTRIIVWLTAVMTFLTLVIASLTFVVAKASLTHHQQSEQVAPPPSISGLAPSVPRSLLH